MCGSLTVRFLDVLGGGGNLHSQDFIVSSFEWAFLGTDLPLAWLWCASSRGFRARARALMSNVNLFLD
jgi:hypothetical protein